MQGSGVIDGVCGELTAFVVLFVFLGLFVAAAADVGEQIFRFGLLSAETMDTLGVPNKTSVFLQDLWLSIDYLLSSYFVGDLLE